MNKIKLNILSSFVFIFFSLIFAQSEEILILDINIEGNKRLSNQDILRNARLFKGMTLSGPEIQQGIKRLWKLERFRDIQILVDNETDNGISLRIIVDEFPTLGKIKFKGNKKKSSRALLDELELETGQILSDRLLFDAKEKIKSIYAEKHYHNIEISTTLSQGRADYIKDIEFLISIGNKTKIKKISFIGNNIYSDGKLTKQFENNKAQKWYLPWRGAWKEDLFEDDKTSLINFYKNKGYRDFYIKEEEIKETKKGYEITIMVYEGPQYKIRDIVWEGNFIHTDQQLAERLNHYKGEVFIEEKFNLSISERVSPLYSDKGYFYCQINPYFKPIGLDSLDIRIEVIENQIVHVRKINITGNDKTYGNVIRRELRVFPGDTFNRKKLMDSYRDVFMLNFFDNVTPDIIPISEDEIDIQLDVSEKSTGQANLSMGYNGIYGFTGGGGFEFPNFRGKGQTISISYQRGLSSNTNTGTYTPSSYQSQNTTAYQSFSLSFTEPWLFDTPNLIGGSYFYTVRGQGQGNYLPFDTHQHGGSFRLGRRFKWPDHYFRGSWMIRAVTNEYIASESSSLSSYFNVDDKYIEISKDSSFTFSSTGISLTQTITRDSRNHPEFPTSGSKSILTSTISGGILGGNQNYHKHILDFNYFIPIHKKITISQIFKTGILRALSSRDDNYSVIPPSARFIMGGTGIPYGEMLRGYTENRVGPLSTRGGNVMMKYSMELRFSISANPTIYALSFLEMGNVWKNSSIIDPFDLKRSAGFGIRVFIPMMGMLGYDMGYGFDYTEYDQYFNGGKSIPHGWEYHLIFGMPF